MNDNNGFERMINLYFVNLLHNQFFCLFLTRHFGIIHPTFFWGLCFTLENQFKCLSGGGCWPMSVVCDGHNDCDDYSDEAHPHCAKVEYGSKYQLLLLFFVLLWNAH